MSNVQDGNDAGAAAAGGDPESEDSSASTDSWARSS